MICYKTKLASINYHHLTFYSKISVVLSTKTLYYLNSILPDNKYITNIKFYHRTKHYTFIKDFVNYKSLILLLFCDIVTSKLFIT